jgi:hypothetical protein
MDASGRGRMYPDLEKETPYVVVRVRRVPDQLPARWAGLGAAGVSDQPLPTRTASPVIAMSRRMVYHPSFFWFARNRLKP